MKKVALYVSEDGATKRVTGAMVWLPEMNSVLICPVPLLPDTNKRYFVSEDWTENDLQEFVVEKECIPGVIGRDAAPWIYQVKSPDIQKRDP